MLKNITNNGFDYQVFVGDLAKFSNAKTIVEIGVLDGDTSVHLLSASRDNGGKFYGYDYWDEIGAYRGQYKISATKDSVTSRLNRHGFTNDNFKLSKVDTTTDSFNEILIEDTQGRIDFAFIDGDHSYNGVKNDFNKIYPYLTEEGIIVFHDTYSHVGCRKFVLELYGELNDGTFDIINLPYGGGNARYGLTLLVKRSYPLYQSGITTEIHETEGLNSNTVYELEKKWYNNEINKIKI